MTAQQQQAASERDALASGRAHHRQRNGDTRARSEFVGSRFAPIIASVSADLTTATPKSPITKAME
jgi:hypothetical protein